MFTLNCKGKLLSLEKPVVMGIINATPDSFYKGNINDNILALAEKMITDGADILDIGGQSTRPGSTRLTAAEELERVLPVINLLQKHFPETILSIDTYHSLVAKIALENGVSIVNDISAGELDADMIPTVAQARVPYICMHMKGTPETMQEQAVYDDVVKDILDFFIARLKQCRDAGIKDVIIDPGFGFGKTIEQNFRLLKHMSVFKMLDKPLLAGLSRKATIYKTLGVAAADALNGTTVLNSIALLNGASILRVHDVKEAKEACRLIAAYIRTN